MSQRTNLPSSATEKENGTEILAMFSESWQIVWNFASSLSVTDYVQEHNKNKAINNSSFNFIIVKTLVNMAQML